jgi:hypothetical protein
MMRTGTAINNNTYYINCKKEKQTGKVCCLNWDSFQWNEENHISALGIRKKLRYINGGCAGKKIISTKKG